MAASAGWLASLLCENADLEGAKVGLQRWGGGVGALLFDKPVELGNRAGDPVAFWSFTIPGPATNGYSGTTGITVKIIWCTPNQNVTGSVVWATAFDLKGATDLPAGCADGFPAYNSTNEVTATTAVTSAVAGGVTYTSMPVTISKIQNGQTTAPAIGDFCRVRLRRNISSASDTLTGPVVFLGGYLLDY